MFQQFLKVHGQEKARSLEDEGHEVAQHIAKDGAFSGLGVKDINSLCMSERDRFRVHGEGGMFLLRAQSS